MPVDSIREAFVLTSLEVKSVRVRIVTIVIPEPSFKGNCTISWGVIVVGVDCSEHHFIMKTERIAWNQKCKYI